MKCRCLEITYRKGAPVAAYFYLPRQEEDFSARAESAENGLLIDFAADGRAIGLEITAPRKATLAGFNSALAKAGQGPVLPDDIAPLLACAAREPNPR